MMVLSSFSMTPGKMESPLGGDESDPSPAKTLLLVHSIHCSMGALMASCTSVRLK